MKHIIIIFGFLSVLSCKQNRTIQFYPNELKNSQFFNIQANKDTTLIGEKGTILEFKANSFQTIEGQDVSGLIEIEFKEFYTIEDFLNNRLSTNTIDGRILKSSGMVFIQAKSDTNTLNLKTNSPMTIKFPRIQESKTANLFAGEKGNFDEIRWSLLEPVYNDTIVIRKESWTKLAYGADYVNVFIQFLIGEDTVELNDNNRKDFEKVLSREPANNFLIETDGLAIGDSTVNYYQYDTDPNRLYVFETTELGYINCDIFIDDELLMYSVQLDNSFSDVYIILDSLNSVLFPDSINAKTNKYMFSVPEDKSISIIAYRKDGNNHFLGVKRTNSGIPVSLINQEEKQLDLVREEVKNLAKVAGLQG